MNRFSITTPIFYVNARPHIGHAYTVVAADVLARAHRLRGDDVFFLTGTDEHGSKVTEAAAGAGETPQAYADAVAAEFQRAWQALDVWYDDFIRTTEARHEQGVREALRHLKDRGDLYEKTYRGLYCVGCEKFITDKELDAEGNCPLHLKPPATVEERNWFFRLSDYLRDVRTRIESDELRIRPEARRNEVLGLLAQGLEDFSISRSRERVPWGIPLPFDESQTAYVWVDALLNYVTALGYGSRDTSRLDRYWPATLQIVGQDILKFHAVYWPALLLALDGRLPEEIFVHGFFTVNGQKISKSLHGEQGRTIGNVIDPLDLVQRYGADATRFLLLSRFPFGASGDVEVDRFDEQYDAVLANTLGNLVSRTITLLQKFSDGKVPDTPADPSFSPAPSHSHAPTLETPTGDLLDSLVNAPVRLAQDLNQYADRTAPWKESDPDKRACALRTLADGVAQLGILTAPVLPRAAKTIQEAFGVQSDKLSEPGTLVRPTDPPILFPRAKDLRTSFTTS